MFRINSTGERPVIAFIFLFRVDLETFEFRGKSIYIKFGFNQMLLYTFDGFFQELLVSTLIFQCYNIDFRIDSDFSCRFWLDFIRLSMRALSIFISNGFVRYPFAPALKHLTWSSTELFAVSINTGIWLVLMSCFIVAQ